MIYLTNFAAAPRLGGPGRRLSIMTYTPVWAQRIVLGTVFALVPGDLFRQYKAGSFDVEAYRDRYTDRLRVTQLAPEALFFTMADGSLHLVKDGDTLCCTCAVEKAQRGGCHRSWAAPLLTKAGWDVMLDGEMEK